MESVGSKEEVGKGHGRRLGRGRGMRMKLLESMQLSGTDGAP